MEWTEVRASGNESGALFLRQLCGTRQDAVLSPAQLQAFARDGFIVLRGVLPKSKVLEARRVVNSELITEVSGEGGGEACARQRSALPRQGSVQTNEMGRLQACANMRNNDALTDLFNSTPLW